MQHFRASLHVALVTMHEGLAAGSKPDNRDAVTAQNTCSANGVNICRWPATRSERAKKRVVCTADRSARRDHRVSRSTSVAAGAPHLGQRNIGW